MPNSLGLTTSATPFGITIPHINNYPEGSSASRSSIEDCHHMKCVIRNGHQSKIVITTCCVIRNGHHNVLCHPERSSIEDCHHNVLCHPEGSSRSVIQLRWSSQRVVSSQLRCVIRSAVITTCCVKKKSPTVAEDFPLNLNQNS